MHPTPQAATSIPVRLSARDAGVVGLAHEVTCREHLTSLAVPGAGSRIADGLVRCVGDGSNGLHPPRYPRGHEARREHERQRIEEGLAERSWMVVADPTERGGCPRSEPRRTMMEAPGSAGTTDSPRESALVSDSGGGDLRGWSRPEAGVDTSTPADKDGPVPANRSENMVGQGGQAATNRGMLPRVGSREFWSQAHRVAFKAAVFQAGGDLEVAQDAAQEAMREAWKWQDDLRNDSGLKSWLRKTARNKVIDHYRKTGRVSLVDPLGEDDPDQRHGPSPLEVDATEDPGEVAVERLVHDELRSAVADTLDMLPDKVAEMVRLYYFDELPTNQIAKQLGVTDGAVRTTLYRARQTLRQHFAVSLPHHERRHRSDKAET